jgi:hypothetical protein
MESPIGRSMGKRRGAALTEHLPSARFHRTWLVEDILPLVISGDRCLIVHRWGRWMDAVEPFRGLRWCIFSNSSVSPHLSQAEKAHAAAFLSA